MNRPAPTTRIDRPQRRPALASGRQHRYRRRCLLIALAAFSCTLALAACGGSSKPSSASTGASSGSTAGLAFSRCMRAHRVPNFPDPGTFMPSNPPAIGVVDNINGAVFLIPGSIDLQAPAVQQAATACKFPGGL